MRCLVFGTGAVGGYLGAKLIQAGWTITFFGRPATCKALKDQGITLKAPPSTQLFKDFKAIDDWPPAGLPEPDLILLTVKTFDGEQAGLQLGSIGWQAPVVCFANGVGLEGRLLDLLPAGMPVIAATLTSAVERETPAEIRVARERGVGIQRAGPASRELAVALRQSGVKVATYANADDMKWSKLVTNLMGNAASALTGLSVDQIYSHPGLFRLELEALREARNVMRAAGRVPVRLPGVPVPWLLRGLALPAGWLQPLLRRAVASGRGGKRPSMFYDIARGRTEVEWLNGAVVDSAQLHDVPAPANQLLLDQVLQLKPKVKLTAEQLLQRAHQAGVPSLAGYNRSGI